MIAYDCPVNGLWPWKGHLPQGPYVEFDDRKTGYCASCRQRIVNYHLFPAWLTDTYVITEPP